MIDFSAPPKKEYSPAERIERSLEAIATALANRYGRGRLSGPSSTPRSYTVPVSNTPIRLTPAVATRRQLTLQNQGASSVTLGHDPSVQYGQGIQIAAGGTATDDGEAVYAGEWWAIANVVGPVNIGVDDQG